MGMESGLSPMMGLSLVPVLASESDPKPNLHRLRQVGVFPYGSGRWQIRTLEQRGIQVRGWRGLAGGQGLS